MGREKQRSELFVYMNGTKVGEVQRSSQGVLSFLYSPEWLSSQRARPLSLSMPMQVSRFSGDVVESFFENLLPDNLSIRNRIQQRFRASSNQSFDLLWHIGRDCVGAIQLLPQDEPPDNERMTLRALSESEIAETLKNYRVNPLGMANEEDFRISIAGAQEKTALLWHNEQWNLPLGATPTSHIFKLPIGKIQYSQLDLSDSVENEWLCHLILKEFGIPIAECEIQQFEDLKVLVVERFDRRWINSPSRLLRLPQEDLCQALGVPPGLKYESDGGPGIQDIMKLLEGSENVLEDRRTFFKAQVLFWLLAAVDGHGKNFSIFLKSGGNYRLTPLYDVMSAHPLVARRQMSYHKLKMAMALRGKRKRYGWNQLQYRHWLSTAKECNFPSDMVEGIISEILENMEHVIQYVESLLPDEFPDSIATPIFEGILKAARKLETSPRA